MQPMIAMNSFASGVRIGKIRPTRYTPAATIVAAWISALTGVGPSIASGSQTCSGNCADLADRAEEQADAHDRQQRRRRTTTPLGSVIAAARARRRRAATQMCGSVTLPR